MKNNMFLEDVANWLDKTGTPIEKLVAEVREIQKSKKVKHAYLFDYSVKTYDSIIIKAENQVQAINQFWDNIDGINVEIENIIDQGEVEDE